MQSGRSLIGVHWPYKVHLRRLLFNCYIVLFIFIRYQDVLQTYLICSIDGESLLLRLHFYMGELCLNTYFEPGSPGQTLRHYKNQYYRIFGCCSPRSEVTVAKIPPMPDSWVVDVHRQQLLNIRSRQLVWLTKISWGRLLTLLRYGWTLNFDVEWLPGRVSIC